MDLEHAKAHCKDRNWQWTLDLINKVQQEMKTLESENKKLKEQLNAQRLYNSCNF